MVKAKNRTAEILLLARSSSTVEELDGAADFILVRVTRIGLEKLLDLSERIAGFVAGGPDAHLISLYLPGGIEVYPLAGDDDDCLENLFNGTDTSNEVVFKDEDGEFALQSRGRFGGSENFVNFVELEPLPGEHLERVAAAWQAEMTVGVETIRFTELGEIYFALLYKYQSGYDYTERFEKDTLEKLF